MTNPPDGEQYSIDPNGKSWTIPLPDASLKELEGWFTDSQHTLGELPIVVVQGLGFVGMAVTGVIASAGKESPLYQVIGVDLPLPETYWKIARMAKGLCPVPGVDLDLDKMIGDSFSRRNLTATSSNSAYSLADYIVVDVPLDVDLDTVDSADGLKIRSAGFEAALRTIGKYMKPDALVLIETTVPAGATDGIAKRILEEERQRRGILEHLKLAHSYERVMPGPNYARSIREFWRVYSAIDDGSAKAANDFLSSFIETDEHPLTRLRSVDSSELAKLIENSYRAANIAFIQEWTVMAEKMGVDLFEILAAIRVRKGTHDNIRFPGFGVGGYCLPKDPLLAQWAAKEVYGSDLSLEMTLKAVEINAKMPLHALELAKEVFADSLARCLTLVCGVSYMPGVPDTRNSPTETLVDALIGEGAFVEVHDSCASRWDERSDLPLSNNLRDSQGRAELVVFATAHTEYKELEEEQILALSKKGARGLCIVDANDVIGDELAASLYRCGCRLIGVGKGHWRKMGLHK